MLNEENVQTIRRLAKTDYYQTVFGNCKDLQLRLFKNKDYLTEIQVVFINYLNFYSSLFMDVSIGDIDEVVTTHAVFEDAYMANKEYLREKKFKNNTNTKPGNSDSFTFD